MLECNIDGKGQLARFLGGVASILGALVLGWYAVLGAVFGGAFAIWEARAGWCIVRALGFKTPL